MARRKRFTVGLWMTLKERSGQPAGLQIWSILKGVVEKPKLDWHTVVLAENEDEALHLAHQKYAGLKQSEAA
ncbi:MAG: hypothetical protein ACXAC5_02550 [Promethearchaeota archaeon]|jgi:hypothetical protein